MGNRPKHREVPNQGVCPERHRLAERGARFTEPTQEFFGRETGPQKSTTCVVSI